MYVFLVEKMNLKHHLDLRYSLPALIRFLLFYLKKYNAATLLQ